MNRMSTNASVNTAICFYMNAAFVRGGEKSVRARRSPAPPGKAKSTDGKRSAGKKR